jgi:hypothetical protein
MQRWAENVIDHHRFTRQQAAGKIGRMEQHTVWHEVILLHQPLQLLHAVSVAVCLGR